MSEKFKAEVAPPDAVKLVKLLFELRGKKLSDQNANTAALLVEGYARLRGQEAEQERDAAKTTAFYAFVSGAKWWEWHQTGATMWPSDVTLAEAVAGQKYPYTPHALVLEAKGKAEKLADAARGAVQCYEMDDATLPTMDALRSALLEFDAP